IGAGQSALETAALLSECGAEPLLIARRPTVFWAQKPVTDRPLIQRMRAPISPLAGPDLQMWLYSKAIGKFRFFSPESRLRRGAGLRRGWKTLGPGGAWWVRDRVDQRIPLMLGYTIVDAREDGDALLVRVASNGSEQELQVDHVIAGTGYKVDIDRLSFLAPQLLAEIRRVGTNPQLSAHFESSAAGLYFTGPPATGTFAPAMRFVFGSAFASHRIAGHRALRSKAPRRRPAAVAEAGAEA